MAHKKAGGSSRNGRNSNPKMLGVKLFGGEAVAGGNVIVRQRGTKFYAGEGVGMGKDHTLFALREGRVSFAPATSAVPSCPLLRRGSRPRWRQNKAAEDIGRHSKVAARYVRGRWSAISLFYSSQRWKVSGE